MDLRSLGRISAVHPADNAAVVHQRPPLPVLLQKFGRIQGGGQPQDLGVVGRLGPDDDIPGLRFGGEYPLQDGFGWTNGVYLKILDTFYK